jgi:hypothetical protein
MKIIVAVIAICQIKLLRVVFQSKVKFSFNYKKYHLSGWLRQFYLLP